MSTLFFRESYTSCEYLIYECMKFSNPKNVIKQTYFEKKSSLKNKSDVAIFVVVLYVVNNLFVQIQTWTYLTIYLHQDLDLFIQREYWYATSNRLALLLSINKHLSYLK
jgi:hypothetical protein